MVKSVISKLTISYTMKLRYLSTLSVATLAAITLPSCDKNNTSIQSATEEVDNSQRVAEFAQSAGFAQFIPAGSELYMGIKDGSKVVQQLMDSSFGQYLSSTAAESGAPLSMMTQNPGFRIFADVTSEEFFIATGPGSAERFATAMQASQASNFMNGFTSVLEVSKMHKPELEVDSGAATKAAFLSDEFLSSLKTASLPPIYVGCKVSDNAKRAQLIQQIQSACTEMLAEQDADERLFLAHDVAGFNGFKLDPAVFKTLLNKELSDDLDEEALAKLLDVCENKNLIAVVGEHQDYLVFFIGSADEQLKFAASPAESILADKAMEGTLDYSDSQLHGLIFTTEELYKAALEHSGSFEAMAKGALKALSAYPAFADTATLQESLLALIEKEVAYYSQFEAGDYWAIAHAHDGFAIDSYYAKGMPNYDLQTGRSLSKVADAKDAIFSASWVNNPDFTEASLQYLEAIVDVADQGLSTLGSSDTLKTELADTLGPVTMFNMMFRGQVTDIWQKAIRKQLASGLGAESAFVIDGQGTIPTIPMLPKAFVEGTQFPRISYASTVADRSKLSASWDTLNQTIEQALQSATALTGSPIPMQKPFKIDAKDLTTWTFMIPFTHQNCMPNVSLNDDIMVVGTSTAQANEIASYYDPNKSGTPLAESHFHFAPFKALTLNWLEQVTSNGQSFIPQEQIMATQLAAPQVKAFLKSLDQLQSIDWEIEAKGEGSLSRFQIKVK